MNYSEQNNFYVRVQRGDLINAYKFHDYEQRDRLIAEFYPERKCSDVPGHYRLPNGNTLEVFMLEAKEYKGA